MRHEDWQARFWKAIDAASARQFEWGTHDCVLFAASVADAISDREYLRLARDAFAWNDARSAIALTKDDGLQFLVETVLGNAVRAVDISQGDIALIVDDEGKQSLAIHDGCSIVGIDAIGLKKIPFRYVKAGWKID